MRKVIDILVILLGIYMIVGFNGGKFLVPPVISGIALILIGVRSMIPSGAKAQVAEAPGV